MRVRPALREPRRSTGEGGVIAIDGKSLKGAYEKGERSSPSMMVSAYAAGLRLTLATVAAKDRDEVDAALEVIGVIDLKGRIVTGDALHCNRRMVEAIVAKGGDYASRSRATRSCCCRMRVPAWRGEQAESEKATSYSQDRDKRARPRRDAHRCRRRGERACRIPSSPASKRSAASRRPGRLRQLDRSPHLRAVPKAVAADAARDRSCSLADRERAALAARRLVRRGRRTQPQGQRPSKHRGDPSPRARHRPPR